MGQLKIRFSEQIDTPAKKAIAAAKEAGMAADAFYAFALLEGSAVV